MCRPPLALVDSFSLSISLYLSMKSISTLRSVFLHRMTLKGSLYCLCLLDRCEFHSPGYVVLARVRQVGLEELLEAIEKYGAQFPNVSHWRPSALLQQLVKDEMSLKQWARSQRQGSKL